MILLSPMRKNENRWANSQSGAAWLQLRETGKCAKKQPSHSPHDWLGMDRANVKSIPMQYTLYLIQTHHKLTRVTSICGAHAPFIGFNCFPSSVHSFLQLTAAHFLCYWVYSFFLFSFFLLLFYHSLEGIDVKINGGQEWRKKTRTIN